MQMLLMLRTVIASCLVSINEASTFSGGRQHRQLRFRMRLWPTRCDVRKLMKGRGSSYGATIASLTTIASATGNVATQVRLVLRRKMQECLTWMHYSLRMQKVL